MTTVTISNTPVQIDLAFDESITVPDGEQWRVRLLPEVFDGELEINGASVFTGAENSEISSEMQVDLFGGDTIKNQNGQAAIRGYEVSP